MRVVRTLIALLLGVIIVTSAFKLDRINKPLELDRRAEQLTNYMHNLYYFYFPVESHTDRVKRIQKRIVQAIGQEARAVKVIVLQDPSWNAFATTRGNQHIIAMLTGLLNASSDDEVALVLAHEYAHIMLGHVGEPQDAGHVGRVYGARTKHLEKMADYWGHYVAIKAGFNPCAGASMWKNIAKLYGDYMYGDSHPSPSQRYFYMNEACEAVR